MKLLVFCHRCDRTGAEIALQHYIQNADRTAIKIAVACGAPGAISENFPPDVRVYKYSHALSFAQRAFKNNSLGGKFANNVFDSFIRMIHWRVRPDAWYINTIVQPKIVALARKMRVPCILHTHEQEHMFAQFTPEEIEDMIGYPRLIIAASESAAEIMRSLGRRGNIEVCYPPIDISQRKISRQNSNALRKDLGIPSDAFVWAMAGTRDPNKNPVGFVRIVDKIVKQAPKTHFMWIGGTDTGYTMFARALAEKFDVHNKISWIPECGEEYFDYLNAADGFMLTSFYETFPLVILEAASLGKPIVSFHSCGPTEIFRAGMGALVPTWDVNEMVEAMVRIMRGDVGFDANLAKARAAEFDITIAVKRWERIILESLDNSGPVE